MSIERVEVPSLMFQERIPGLSAMMRVRNGADFLELTIRSHIELVDEIIIVFNNCQDNTEEIVHHLAQEFDKIKAFNYVPIVYPPNSTGYLETPEDDPHSLAYYYNFALSKTTRQQVFKLDDDHLCIPHLFQKAVELSKSGVTVGLRGMNIFDWREQIFHSKISHTGGTDLHIFTYNNNVRFKKTDKYEVLRGVKPQRHTITYFYHLKHCKRDRGLNNYELTINPNSRYLQIAKDEVFCNDHKPLNTNTNYPHPLDLGFKFIDHSQKHYNYEPFNELETQISLKVTKKRVILIGNGSVSKDYSEFVNNSNVVLRINDYVNKEHVKYKGTKVDIMCFCGAILAPCIKFMQEYENIADELNAIWIARSLERCLKYELFNDFVAMENKFNQVPRIHMDAKHFGDIQKKFGLGNGSWPSTGYMVIEMMLKLFNLQTHDLYILGFDTIDELHSKRYEGLRYHPLAAERKMIHQLVKNGILTHLR